MILLLACSPALRAQKGFEVCQGAGAEITRQGGPANPQREFCIGYVYAFGRGVPKDMGKAVTHFRAAADKGYAPAQAVLGVNYANGLGVTQNWAEAARWYRKAAEAGHGGAAVNLGLCYQNGNGVPQDRKEAARWYKIAADHGDPSAAGLLAALEGSSQPKGPAQQANAPANDIFQQGASLYKAGDYAGALRYFRRAAEAGNPWAELQIGYQYENAEGVPQNNSEAVQWYTKSAQHGNARGQKNLGQMYEAGKGISEDWVTAAAWYRKSADQNWQNGQYALARAYQFGIGVPQSRQTAIEWFRRAAANGDSEAAYFAQDLSSPGNFIGFRNVAEHDMVIGGKLRFGLNLPGADRHALSQLGRTQRLPSGAATRCRCKRGHRDVEHPQERIRRLQERRRIGLPSAWSAPELTRERGMAPKIVTPP
ncbi:MAG: tetratricopeptide repeat protein, partial [Bryobacteraceae bacterium]